MKTKNSFSMEFVDLIKSNWEIILIIIILSIVIYLIGR